MYTRSLVHVTAAYARWYSVCSDVWNHALYIYDTWYHMYFNTKHVHHSPIICTCLVLIICTCLVLNMYIWYHVSYMYNAWFHTAYMYILYHMYMFSIFCEIMHYTYMIRDIICTCLDIICTCLVLKYTCRLQHMLSACTWCTCIIYDTQAISCGYTCIIYNIHAIYTCVIYNIHAIYI